MTTVESPSKNFNRNSNNKTKYKTLGAKNVLPKLNDDLPPPPTPPIWLKYQKEDPLESTLSNLNKPLTVTLIIKSLASQGGEQQQQKTPTITTNNNSIINNIKSNSGI